MVAYLLHLLSYVAGYAEACNGRLLYYLSRQRPNFVRGPLLIAIVTTIVMMSIFSNVDNGRQKYWADSANFHEMPDMFIHSLMPFFINYTTISTLNNARHLDQHLAPYRSSSPSSFHPSPWRRMDARH